VVYFLVLSGDCAIGLDRGELVLITFDRSAQFHERARYLQEHSAAGIGAKTRTSSKAMEMEQ
jgi:hypothetical protein